MRCLSAVFAFSLAVLWIGCDSGGGPDTLGATTAAAGVMSSDIGNAGDGSDLRISFRRGTPTDGIVEYRVFVVKSASAAGFNAEVASGLGPDRFTSFPSEANVEANLASDARDSDGAIITDDVPYRVFVLSVADGVARDENALSAGSLEITLQQIVLVRTLTEEIPIGSGGIEVDAAGNIYIADFGANLNGGGSTIYRITPDGTPSLFASGFRGASGNAFDSQGNLFQSNITAGTISKVTPSGAVSTFVTDGIAGPVGIAIDGDDNLYVANCGDNTIRKVTSAAVSTPFASSQLLNCPNGITLDDSNNLYVANFGNGNILLVTPAGNVSVFATIPGNNNGHITFANGVLYVVARTANQMYELTLSGNATLLAGSGRRGRDDGPALTATMSLPNDVAVSPDGEVLYVNDVAPTSGATNIISPIVVREIILTK